MNQKELDRLAQQGGNLLRKALREARRASADRVVYVEIETKGGQPNPRIRSGYKCEEG